MVAAADTLHQMPVQQALEPGLECFDRWRFKGGCGYTLIGQQ
jgi:hypothetical protein